MKEIKEMLNKNINYIIVLSVLAFIVGLIMIIFPTVSIETMGIIAACFIIVHGLVLLYLDLVVSKFYVPFEGLLSGIMSVAFGTFLLCKPSVVPVVFTMVIGLWIILVSINLIRLAIRLYKTELPWVQLLLLGILDLVAGFVLVLNPFESSISIAVLAGIMLVIHSVVTIVDMLIVKNDVKEIGNAIEKKVKELTK